MTEREHSGTTSPEKLKVSRRWFTTRVAVGVAEMAVGLATPGVSEPVGRSVFVGGFGTVGFTLFKSSAEPMLVGAGMGAGTYLMEKIREVANKK